MPPKVRRVYHLDEPGAQVEIIEEPGRLVLIPKIAVDSSQAWFWADNWQSGEATADRQLADGQGITYDDTDAFLADLP